MKKGIILISGIILLMACEKEEGNRDFKPDIINISMKAGYEDNVYLDLEEGKPVNVPGALWDLGFATDPRGSTILINEGKGVGLFAVEGLGAEDWNTTLLSTDRSSWQAMFNADTTWFLGAFERNATGHPDYGWGIYNSQSHDVVGSSIFVVEFGDGSLRKLLIEKRAAANNTFYIRYADLDGSEQVSDSINCSDYLAHNFVYYSITSGEIINNEPESANWDLVFTQYHDESIQYFVTGVLTNINVKSARVESDDLTIKNFEDFIFSSNINTIGSDWKEFNMDTFQYKVASNLVYFIETEEGSVFRLVFFEFEGMSSGNLSFELLQLK